MRTVDEIAAAMSVKASSIVELHDIEDDAVLAITLEGAQTKVYPDNRCEAVFPRREIPPQEDESDVADLVAVRADEATHTLDEVRAEVLAEPAHEPLDKPSAPAKKTAPKKA